MLLNGTYAGILALTEVSLGSALHAARVPLRGQVLSLNQIFLLMRSSVEGGKEASRFSPALISNAAAVLKSLSPAGNKLTPMLAIAMQGWLFTLGILLFGHSRIGRIFGGLLASVWAFLQPLLLYGMIFGSSTLWSSYQELNRWLPIANSSLGIVLGFLCALKMTIVLSMGINISWFEKTHLKISRLIPESHSGIAPRKGAFKQMKNPLFLGSVGLSALLLFFAEGSYSSLIWHLLRPLAVGFAFFYAIRWVPIDRWMSRFLKKPKGVFRIALETVQKTLFQHFNCVADR